MHWNARKQSNINTHFKKPLKFAGELKNSYHLRG